MDRSSVAEGLCRACGACCTLHVSFHESELRRHGGVVPTERTVPWGAPRHVALRRIGERCAALEGVIGEATRCAIYAERPSPCRAFEPSWFADEPNPWCDEARARNGLPPLLPADWGRARVDG